MSRAVFGREGGWVPESLKISPKPMFVSSKLCWFQIKRLAVKQRELIFMFSRLLDFNSLS